ncbi:helix-turn-helix domain-containing protein [Actinomycetospora cinnamomea]|uniref:XRE family transcriptional regulator n=1 Tax=Actinomycetospora cinnamomea TaxID=663609 RepID=A0A2U1F426_9PSEU|nr:XRE family transcriptional regulator [Actinomycetospora cinnamomea]PVZ06912.1 XRE family transcriptional regulator [Actinomycetospora cinnamomea]
MAEPDPVPPPAPGWASVVDAIGPKVRDLRQQAGLSLQQLARRADVSAASVHKVERGDMVPTITTLLKLAEALERPIGHFVDNGAAEPVASVVPAGARPELPSGEPGVHRAGITGPAARFRLQGTITEIDEGGAGADDGPRSGEVLVHVLSGELTFELAGERHVVAAGDTLHYPGDRPARWHATGSGPARAVWLAVRGS